MKKLTAYSLQPTALRILFLSFLLLVLLFPITYNLSPIYAASANLSLSPAVGTFNKGCNFSVDIKVDTGGAQTDGTDAILVYDQTRFTATAVRSGTIYSDYPGNIIDTANGKVTVSGLASVSSPFSGAGTLATIDFTVLETAPEGVTKVRFDFDPADKAKTTDSNVVERGTIADILSFVSDGNYTVGSGSCTVTPTPTPIGTGGSSFGKGGPITTPSAAPKKTIDDFTGNGTKGGIETPTVVLGATGLFLTILGILGAAFL